MSLIDFSTLTLNAEEAKEVSQVVFERVFMKEELQNIHGIQTGIKYKTQIAFLGRFSPFLKTDPGSCGVNSVNQDISTSEKFWDPELISGRLTHCQGTQSDSLFKLWKSQMKANPDYWSEVNNEQSAFLSERIIDALDENVLLLSFFGDTVANNVSGGGNITNGKDKDLFTPIDGFWKQILAEVASGDIPAAQVYDITENDAASKTAQLNLASDRTVSAMRSLVDNIDSRAFQGDLKFQMTRTLYNNYVSWLEDKSVVFTLSEVKEGANALAYRGIPIVMREDWDRNIREYFDQGTTYLDPHRIILSDINNLPIGTVSEEDLDSLDAFYEKKDKKHYIDTAMTLDAKLLEGYALGVGY